ncbi:MAG: hypothetical protein JXX14_18325, partial [Deltaproteobacteria bacterium]|nr:hypothetical protein [Deltaproteobacteria bacterium]
NCQNDAVVQNCSCDGNDDCDADTEYCNDGYLCIEGICNFSAEANPCPSNPCQVGVACDEAARACTPGSNPCDAVATTCDPTSCVPLNDSDFECAADPADDGITCDDELGCNGTSDFCLDGSCVAGGIPAAFCYSDNPCADETTCTENGFGLEPTCTPAADRVIGDDCSADFSCFGAGGTCQVDPSSAVELICIQSEDVCESNGICAQSTCSEDYALGSDSGIDCASVANAEDVSTLTCDDPTVTIAVADGKFTTRTYFDYSATCNPAGDVFQGMETRVYLSLGQAVTDATLTVTDVDAAFTGNMELLLFDSNPCIETNCIQRGTNTLTFSSADNSAIVVLDSTDALWPPATVTLELDCNL